MSENTNVFKPEKKDTFFFEDLERALAVDFDVKTVKIPKELFDRIPEETLKEAEMKYQIEIIPYERIVAKEPNMQIISSFLQPPAIPVMQSPHVKYRGRQQEARNASKKRKSKARSQRQARNKNRR